MEKKDTISELKDISPLLQSAGKEIPFAVPPAYFEALSSAVVANCLRINKNDLTLKSGPFAVPRVYFDELPGNILESVKLLNGFYQKDVADELYEIAPVLSSVNKRNPYTVPDFYFTNVVSIRSINKKSAAKGKVISFSKTRKWFNYVSAAIVAGILVMGAFLFTDNNERFGKDRTVDLHSELHKLSDEELNKYLDNVKPTMNLDQITGVSDADIPDVEENLKTVSDEELKQYLRENDIPETKSETGS